MDGCEISINSYMLNPQYAIPSTLLYSSRLIKSASKRGKTQEHEVTGICLHIISTRSAQKCTFTYACTLPLGRSLDMQQPSYTLLEFQLKGNPDGKGTVFPFGESSYFCSSLLRTSVPSLALWTDQDLCAGRKNQGTGRVRRGTHAQQ